MARATILGGAAVITLNGLYQPQWMRLGEAAAYLEHSRSMNPQAAKDWLLRAIQDQLRADAERYQAQTMFRVAGFPTQWKNRGKPDWPARLTHDRIDWDASTINGQDPVRIIDNDLLIEVSAAALRPDTGATRTPSPSGVQTNKQAALKGQMQCMDQSAAGAAAQAQIRRQDRCGRGDSWVKRPTVRCRLG